MMWEVTPKGFRKLAEEYIFMPVNSYIDFSHDGRFILLSSTDGSKALIFNASTLDMISQYELVGRDLKDEECSNFQSIKLSYDASYIIAGDSNLRFIFTINGEFVKCINGRNMYSIYMTSRNEFMGTKPTPDFSKTTLVALNFINDTERFVFDFNAFVTRIYLNEDFTAFTYEVYPKLFYVCLQNEMQKREILKEYTSCIGHAFKDDKFALIYNINFGNFIVCIYQNEQVIWRQTLKRNSINCQGFVFLKDEEGHMMMLENNNDSIQIHKISELFATDFGMKSMRNINFQYPYILFCRGNKEIWIQDFSNIIQIYYFDNSIVGMENYGNVKFSMDSDLSIGCIFDLYDHYLVGTFEKSEEEASIKLFKRKINYDELPERKIKGFNFITILNQETKKEEPSVILHFKESLIGLSLESNHLRFEVKKILRKSNIISLKNRSAIFFWQNNGQKVEKIKMPINPSNSKYIIRVYDAFEDIRLLKSTMIDGEEYLYIVDEPKYVKLLSNEDNKLSIYKEYFIDSTFASNSDVEQIKEFCFSNEMMYSVNGGYILQEKGRSKDTKFTPLNYSGFSIDFHNKIFPICSDDFVLYALTPELDSINSQYYSYLLLAPPMNSHRIKQRDVDTTCSHEFYLWFDDRYIVQYFNTYSDISFILYNLNGDIYQKLKIKPGATVLRPWISQTGEYMVVPVILGSEYSEENK